MSPYVISAEGGTADTIGLVIMAQDTDLAQTLTVGTFGYTLDNPVVDKIGGGETINQNLLTLGPGEPFVFSISLVQITVNYGVQITLYVSNADCDEKLFAMNIQNVGAADSQTNLAFDLPDDWVTNSSTGTDLILDRSSLEMMTVTSTAGGCYMAQMSVQWLAT